MSSLAKGSAKIHEEERDDESQDEACSEDTVIAAPAKKIIPENKTMLKIPIYKQSNTADCSPVLTATKGKMPKPNISNLEKKKPKRVKSDETVDTSNEEKVFNNTSNLQAGIIPRTMASSLQTGISPIADEKAKDSITAQLEMMNRLLMINAAVGIKNQSLQNNQTSQSLQHSQTLNSLLQNQEKLMEIDMSQLETIVQGFLGQNPNAANMHSQIEKSSSNLANTSSLFNMDSRPMTQPNYFNPQTYLPKSTEIQKMLMQQTTLHSNSSNSQAFSNQASYSTLPGPMSTYGALLNQAAQSMMSSAPNYSSFQNMSFPGSFNFNMFGSLFNPKVPSVFQNSQGNFQELIRQVSSTFPKVSGNLSSLSSKVNSYHLRIWR